MRRADNIHTNYVATKNKNVSDKFIPKSVFDDGQKTYIEITSDNTQNMPVIYYYDDYDKKKLQLANYRLKGNFLEIDRVMNNMKLQFSQKSYLLISRVDENETVPSAKKIQFNQNATKTQLSIDSMLAGNHQSDAVEFKDEAPMSLKERLEERERQRQLELIRAANGSDNDDALNRLADALQEDDSNSQEDGN